MGTGINTKGNEQSWIFELQQFLVERWTLYSSYVLLVELLQIRQKSYAVLLGALLIAFPAMASLFAYMFTAPYYMFAVLLMIVAVYTAVRYPYGYLPAIVIIAFSMGIYQTYFGVATSLFVLIL